MKKEDINEEGYGHRIISPKLLLSDNKKDIEVLLLIIAKKYRISIDDAKISLAKTLERLQ